MFEPNAFQGTSETLRASWDKSELPEALGMLQQTGHSRVLHELVPPVWLWKPTVALQSIRDVPTNGTEEQDEKHYSTVRNSEGHRKDGK